MFIDPDRLGLPEGFYCRHDLALIHHRGFGFHAQACAPGIPGLLEPVRSRAGIVLELGCGSGLLTRELTAAGHRVIATDASPTMLTLARSYATAAEDIRTLVLPHDPLPLADAVVSVGRVLNYLSDEQAIKQALTVIARALRPGGLFAIDICDLEYGQACRRRFGRRRSRRSQRPKTACGSWFRPGTRPAHRRTPDPRGTARPSRGR